MFEPGSCLAVCGNKSLDPKEQSTSFLSQICKPLGYRDYRDLLRGIQDQEHVELPCGVPLPSL